MISAHPNRIPECVVTSIIGFFQTSHQDRVILLIYQFGKNDSMIKLYIHEHTLPFIDQNSLNVFCKNPNPSVVCVYKVSH